MSTPATQQASVFPGNSEMARRMAELDWEATSLGPADSWPQSLRTAVRILLTSCHAMWMGWGPDLAFLYNDAYRRTLGLKHPAALGWPVQQVWSEIWDDIGPRVRAAMDTGSATWDEGVLLVLERSGYVEETYHTFSYSPLIDDDGSISGVLCVVIEDTDRVIGERRLALVQDLSSSLARTTTEPEAVATIERVLANGSQDLPFTLTYLFKEASSQARLTIRTGIPFDHPAAPQLMEIGANDPAWPAEALLQGNAPILVNNLAAQFDDLPTGVWDKPAQQALLVPFARKGQTQPAGFLVAGLNPFRRMDEAYSGFIKLIAGQVAAIEDITARIEAEEAQRRLQHERDEVLARFELQFERMPIACAVFDPQWRVIEWNPAAEMTFGYRRDEVVGREGPPLIVPPPLRTRLQDILDRLTAHDMSAHSVNENLTKDGRTIICDWRNTPLFDATGEMIGVISMAQDITERVQAQEALSQVNRRIDLALKGSDIGVWELEFPDGQFESGRVVYSTVEEQLGYPRPESTPDLAALTTLVHPEDSKSFPDAYRAYLAGRTPLLEFEQRLRHHDGSYRTMLSRGVAIRDAAGKPTRVIGSRVDITELKRAEESLRASEARLTGELAGMKRLQSVSTRLVQASDSVSLLEEIMGAAITITGADKGNIQLLDRATGELRIVASQGFQGPYLDYFNAVHAGEAACGTAMERGDRVVIEDVRTDPIFAGSSALEILLAAGVRAVQSTPLLDRSGRVLGMLSTHYREPHVPADRDINILDQLARQAADWIERTQTEQARRDSEARFRRLFELGPIGRAITSPVKGFVEVNDGFCSILGYDRAELLQKNWAELTQPDDLAADVEQFNRVLAGEIDEYSLDKRYIRKDGSIVDTTIWVNCLRCEDGAVDYFVALVQDVTERKRADEALRWSEERYRSLVSKVRDFAIFSTDELGVVTSWNEGCQDVLGYGLEEFVGLDSAELFTPQDRAAGVPAAALRQSVQAGTAVIDRWMITKEGRQFFAMGATAPLRDATDSVIGFSCVMRDVTPMKESQDRLTQRGESLERLVSEKTGELEATAGRLRVSERMAALGTLAAGLGHDMGNLLLPMDVRLSLLIEADLPRELHEHVVGIQKCARYLQRLSRGLRLLATDPANVEFRGVTDLGKWWNDVRLILKDVLPGGIRFEYHVPEAESWVGMGRTGLTQAVYNLVQNSADAIKEHGGSRVSIHVDTDPSDPWVTIRVADDGPGMTEEVARHCIEPYFSTKARGQSTGMGLALVHALVTGTGGQLQVQSTPGEGTTISLILPRPSPKEPMHNPAAGMPAGGLRAVGKKEQ